MFHGYENKDHCHNFDGTTFFLFNHKMCKLEKSIFSSASLEYTNQQSLSSNIDRFESLK